MFGFIALVALAQWPAWNFPPYVEQCGLWMEASWLAEHDFDYSRLLHEERHGEDGGPRAYFCTVMPTLLAVVMRLLPTPFAPIIAYRVFNIFCGAVILLVVHDMTSRKESRFQGIASAVALLALPLFRVQAEMLGMDIPMTAAAMLWWRATSRQHYRASLGWSVVAYLIKPSAFILPMASALHAGVILLRDHFHAARFRWMMGWACLNLGLVVAELGILVMAGNLRGRMVPLLDLPLWLNSSPDLLLLTAGTLGLWVRGVRRQLLTPQPGQNLEAFYLTGWGVVMLTMAAASLTHYESRHLTIVVPFVVVLFSVSLKQWSARTGNVLLALLIATNLVNSHGRFFPTLERLVARGWGVPERSLEYRADLASIMNACEMLDRDCREEPVLALDQFAYMLKLPSLGLVSKGRVEGDARFEHISKQVDADVLRMLDDAPKSIVVTHVVSQIGDWPFPAYQVSPPTLPTDKILFEDDLEPPIVIYRREIPADATLRERYRAYLDLLFVDAVGADPAARLVILGSERHARIYVSEETGESEDSPHVTAELIRRTKELARQWEEDAPRMDPLVANRRIRVAKSRLELLEKGLPLLPLRWSERTLTDTLIQRVCYFPPLPARDP